MSKSVSPTPETIFKTGMSSVSSRKAFSLIGVSDICFINFFLHKKSCGLCPTKHLNAFAKLELGRTQYTTVFSLRF